MDFKSILLAQKTGYIPHNHFDALFARKIGGAVLKDFPGLPASIVTVTDALAKPLDSLKVAITPIQSGSGDPSPDNIRPISGWTECNVTRTGKNLLKPSMSAFEQTSGYYTWQKDIIPAGAIANMSFTDKDTSVDVSEVFFGFVYDDLASTTGAPLEYRWILTSGTINRDTSNVSTMMGKKLCRSVFAYPKDFATISKIFSRWDVQVELGSTATTYEPYTGQTYPITFPSEAGTVYGGTLDVTNGVLTVTDASVDLGTLTWQAASNNKYFYSNGIVATAKKAASSDTPANMICEQYKSVSRNTLVNGSGDCEVAINTSSLLQLKDARFAEYTPSDVQTAVTGIKLVYELATPQTYQLTPTEVQMLLGTNNIWADTGDILEGKYWSKNPVTVTQAMLNTLRDAGEITEITEPEENDER